MIIKVLQKVYIQIRHKKAKLLGILLFKWLNGRLNNHATTTNESSCVQQEVECLNLIAGIIVFRTAIANQLEVTSFWTIEMHIKSAKESSNLLYTFAITKYLLWNHTGGALTNTMPISVQYLMHYQMRFGRSLASCNQKQVHSSYKVRINWANISYLEYGQLTFQ